MVKLPRLVQTVIRWITCVNMYVVWPIGVNHNLPRSGILKSNTSKFGHGLRIIKPTMIWVKRMVMIRLLLLHRLLQIWHIATTLAKLSSNTDNIHIPRTPQG